MLEGDLGRGPVRRWHARDARRMRATGGVDALLKNGRSDVRAETVISISSSRSVSRRVTVPIPSGTTAAQLAILAQVPVALAATWNETEIRHLIRLGYCSVPAGVLMATEPIPSSTRYWRPSSLGASTSTGCRSASPASLRLSERSSSMRTRQDRPALIPRWTCITTMLAGCSLGSILIGPSVSCASQ